MKSGVQIYMTASEVQCYRYCIGNARTLLEFGSGGSTLFAMQLGVPDIYSIESDPDWIEKLRNTPEFTSTPEERRSKLIYRDIGRIGKWGKPADESAKERWPSYHSDIWKEIDPKLVDCVLVDGRFRIACTLQAVLHIRTDSLIIIHDFWNREHYHVVLPFLEVVARADRLVVARARHPLDEAAVRACLKEYEFDSR